MRWHALTVACALGMLALLFGASYAGGRAVNEREGPLAAQGTPETILGTPGKYRGQRGSTPRANPSRSLSAKPTLKQFMDF